MKMSDSRKLVTISRFITQPRTVFSFFVRASISPDFISKKERQKHVPTAFDLLHESVYRHVLLVAIGEKRKMRIRSKDRLDQCTLC